MVLSAPLAATASPPEPTHIRRAAELSLAVAFTSSAAVRRRRGEVNSFRGNSTKYNTTNPQTWTLTSVGDWSSWNNFSTTAETRTHGAAHELTRIGSGTTPATILYDVKGNITQNQRTPGTSSTYQNYVWAFDNRMISADTNGDNTADVTFEYDALGRRVARTQGATAVVYIHAGQQVVCDYTRGANANTTPAFRYVWGDYIDEPILRQTGSSTLLYYHHNQQYSTVALTSASGLIVTRYGYTAYGDQTIMSHTGAMQTFATYSNRYTFTGPDWDDSLKAHYFRARWYDAALGRFVNRDPIGYVDGMSLHRGYFVPSGFDPYGEQYSSGIPRPAGPPPHSLQDLENVIKSLCNSCDWRCTTGCNKSICIQTAYRIARAIWYTWQRNAAIPIRFSGPKDRRGIQTEAVKGFNCYEWAYSFDDAIKFENANGCFSTVAQQAGRDSMKIHAWVALSVACPGGNGDTFFWMTVIGLRIPLRKSVIWKGPVIKMTRKQDCRRLIQKQDSPMKIGYSIPDYLYVTLSEVSVIFQRLIVAKGAR